MPTPDLKRCVCVRNNNGRPLRYCATCEGLGWVGNPVACSDDVPAWLERIRREMFRLRADMGPRNQAVALLGLLEWGDESPVPMPRVEVRSKIVKLSWERDGRCLDLLCRVPGYVSLGRVDAGRDSVTVVRRGQVQAVRRGLEWVVTGREGKL